MTEDELVDDLSRLLREGLVMVADDPLEHVDVPRFMLTARGRAEADEPAAEDAS